MPWQILTDAASRVRFLPRLKYKYFRSMDMNRVDLLGECFTEDATADYSTRKWRFKGKKAILEFIKEYVLRDGLIGTHQGHNPEIDITSDTTAKGIWELWEYMIDTPYKKGQRTAVFYHDEYVKEKGEWKIKSTAITPIFREVWDREALKYPIQSRSQD